ncbi:GPN-loop GTPase [Chaetomium sp. MPI-CAGE-AT-0009]|nr:GPN-loop GTPase [Chaetomium sp. MPI-CAGE-AT-0009]
MSKYGVMVMGPAGVGKSTFCASLITHLQLNRRSAFYVNLDPAAEHFEHTPDLDIKDLISLEDNLDFLSDALDSLTEEYLIIIDMPGQIELYTHIPVLPTLVKFLSQPGALDVRLCAAYLLESTFVLDRAKYFAGTLSAMSAMMMLEVSHINVLTKMDLIKDQMRKKDFKRFLVPDTTLLEDDPADTIRKRTGVSVDVHSSDPADKDALMSGATFKRLNTAVANLIESYSLVNYLKLDCTDEESVQAILSHIDDCIQYHEAQEPKDPPEEEFEEEP